MPQPALSEDRLSHSSDGGFPGERDLVETSADLQTWTTDGVVSDDERWKKNGRRRSSGCPNPLTCACEWIANDAGWRLRNPFSK